MPKKYTNYKKTSKTPRKPFDKDRLINELRVVGTYGLRCKREAWRVQLTLAKIRKAARSLMTLADDDKRNKESSIRYSFVKFLTSNFCFF